MSLLATSYRYEKMTAKPGLVRALSRQAERVQADEYFAGREKQARADAQTNLLSAWTETLEFKQQAKTGVRLAKDLKGELACARKAAVLVRRAALKKQMDDEYNKYEQELQKMGKTFYIKRE